MTELLSGLPRLATIVFAVSSMLAVGFSYSLRDIFGPLRRFPRVVRALAANFFVVPLIAYLVTQVLALEAPQAAGLILVGTAAGAPFLIKLTTAAEGDVALSATLLVLLLPATVGLMPFIVPLLLPGTTLSAQVIAVPLVVTMLLPLAVGLLVRARAPGWAERLRPTLGVVSSYALVVMVAATVLINLSAILDMTLRAIAAALLLTGGAFVVGYLLGGRNPAAREVLGLGTGQRNIAAATVVAAQGFGPDTLIMVIVASLLALAVLFPVATKLRERGALRDAEVSASSVDVEGERGVAWTTGRARPRWGGRGRVRVGERRRAPGSQRPEVRDERPPKEHRE
jgi:predicted Na+-dependent transporter